MSEQQSPTGAPTDEQVAHVLSELSQAARAHTLSLIVCWTRCICCATTVLFDNGYESELCAKCQRDYEYELPCWSRNDDITAAYESGQVDAVPALEQLQGHLERVGVEQLVLLEIASQRDLLLRTIEELWYKPERVNAMLAGIRERTDVATDHYHETMDSIDARYPDSSHWRIFDRKGFPIYGRPSQANQAQGQADSDTEASRQDDTQEGDQQERPPYARQTGESSLFRGGHDL